MKIEYLGPTVESIIKKDHKKGGAKPPARRGCSAYALESEIHRSSLFNLTPTKDNRPKWKQPKQAPRR
ncbi:MAG: hypothetical protein PVG84_18515, partial [Desulfobacterales bacterium]